jgi:hypothetical protein
VRELISALRGFVVRVVPSLVEAERPVVQVLLRRRLKTDGTI